MEEMLFTVKEVGELIKTNSSYVYKLINAGLLPVLKLGSLKIRKSSLECFLEQNEGQDLTDPFNIVELRKG